MRLCGIAILCLSFCGLLSADENFGLPKGFKSNIFAAPPDITFPVGVAASPEGDVYVSVDRNSSLSTFPNKGSIIKCSDTDGDGKADKFTKFVENIDSPRNGCFVGGTLYMVNPPFLTTFTDTNGDGKADKKDVLIKGMGFDLSFRGADHTSNGCRMGIDGWLYIAIGDYGMVKAEAKDGSTVHLHGGGVLRVRPDGSSLEIFTKNTRNIYDVAVSPYLDLFTRDNTNDGKGWNTRFHHFTSMADMGYPRLYKNFKDEHMKSLADFGGGSGTGALYIQEPGFPAPYNDMMYSCDFTTQKVYSHPMKKHEATFVTGQETFFETERAIDIDVDGNSQIFVCNFKGGKYRFSENPVGTVFRITYPGLQAAKFPNLTKLSNDQIIDLLKSESSVCRINSQRELLKRGLKGSDQTNLKSIVESKSSQLYSRIAALNTLKLALGSKANGYLSNLVNDPTISEYALRALTDDKNQLSGVDEKVIVAALSNNNPRVRLQAVIGIARLGKKELADNLLSLAENMKSSNDAVLSNKKVDTVSAFQTYKHAVKELSLDVTGAKKLYLIALGGHDGSEGDLADWLEPTLKGSSGELKLTELKWVSASNPKTFVNKSAAGKPLAVKGVKSKKGKKTQQPAINGIGTQADSVIVFDIPAGYSSFTVGTVIDNLAASKREGTVEFIVTTKSPDISSLSSADKHLAIPHTVCKAMSSLNAFEAALKGIKSPATRQAAIYSLNQMHDEKAVDAIISQLKSTEDKEEVVALIQVLFRLYQIDKKWDGKVWWTTKPDDRGPYFEPVTWSASGKIKSAIEEGFTRVDQSTGIALLSVMRKNRIEPSSFNLSVKEDAVTVIVSKNVIDEKDAETLIESLSTKGRSRAQLTQIFEALGKSSKAFEGQLKVLDLWNSQKLNDEEFQGRLKDFIYSPAQAAQVNKVLHEAEKGSAFTGKVAWMTALNLVNTPLTDAKVKAVVDKAVKNSKSSPQLYTAMAEMGIKTYKTKIIDAAKNADGPVKKAAQRAVAKLKLNSASGEESKLIASLKPEVISRLVEPLKGDAKNGAALFLKQGCIACHAVSMDQVQKGPFLGSAGSKFSKQYLIESIIEPGKVVAQGFQTTQITMKDGAVYQGFITSRVGDEIEVRNIAGLVTKISAKNVKTEKILKVSMMPPGLAATLTVSEFADLIAYMQSMKSK